MSRYLLIESRDPFESKDSHLFFAWAGALAHEGHEVTLFLVQDGVMAARALAAFPPLSGAVAAGVTLAADAFALRERGIGAADLSGAVRAAPLDELVARLASGCKTLWH